MIVQWALEKGVSIGNNIGQIWLNGNFMPHQSQTCSSVKCSNVFLKFYG